MLKPYLKAVQTWIAEGMPEGKPFGAVMACAVIAITSQTVQTPLSTCGVGCGVLSQLLA